MASAFLRVLKIVDDKARLVSDTLCDGRGACLGHCPQGAINIDRREAATFDEAAAQRHVASLNVSISQPKPGNSRPTSVPATKNPFGHAGCPSSRFARLKGALRRSDTGAKPGGVGDAGGTNQDSELTRWPVQLRLLPPTAPVLKGARLLFAAACVPFAYRGFHANLLRDHAVVIACPKLDDPSGYVEKLTEIIRQNDLAEITVARMEVPCCGGILQMTPQARQLARNDVVVSDIVISVRGEVLARRQAPAHPTGSGNCESTRCPSIGS